MEMASVEEVGGGATDSLTVSIFGSCVSRDAFDTSFTDMRVGAYVARSALASAFEDTPFKSSLDQLDPEHFIKSPFQRKMIETDLAKSAGPTLAAAQDETDCYLVDLIDERFPIIRDRGAVATISLELRTCGAVDRLGAPLIAWDTQEHFEGFCRGFDKLAAATASTGRPLVLNKVFWAEKCSDGTEFSTKWIRSSNEQLQRRYEIIESKYDLATIAYPKELLVALVGHRWSKAPYHYIDEMYEHQRSELRRLILETRTDVEA